MHTRLLLPLVLLLTATTCRPASSPTPAASHPLVGTWEMVSARYARPDGTVSQLDSSQVRALKILGPGHFSYITQRADGTFVHAAAGAYRTSGNGYTEQIHYASRPHMQGMTYPFTYRVEGDTWYHEGELSGTRASEVWRRVR